MARELPHAHAKRKFQSHKKRKQQQKSTPTISVRPWRRKRHTSNIALATKHMTLEEMETEQRKAKADYKKGKKDSANLRLQFPETLDPEVCAKLKRKEEARKLGRVARPLTGKLQSKSVELRQNTMARISPTELRSSPACWRSTKPKHKRLQKPHFWWSLWCRNLAFETPPMKLNKSQTALVSLLQTLTHVQWRH